MRRRERIDGDVVAVRYHRQRRTGDARKWWRRISVGDGVVLDERPAQSLDSVEVKEAYLIDYEILPLDEIARLVGAKTETIWSRLHYPRREFAERLARRREL